MQAVKEHIATKLVPQLRFQEFAEECCTKAFDELVKVIDCKHRTPPYVEEGIPLVSPGTIKWGEIDLITPTKRVSEEEYESLMDHCSPDVGDLVFSRNQSIGVASFLKKKEKFVLGQDTVLIQAKTIDSIYNYYRLQTHSVQALITRLSGGSTFARINLKDLRKLKVTVVDNKKEQQKIASFLSAVDEKIQHLTKKKTLLEQYKKGIMQQLFSGQLRFKDENGNQYPDWGEKKLGELTSLLKDGTHGTHKDTPGSDYYLLSAKNIKNGSIFIDESDRRISEEEYNGIYKNYCLKENDILLTVVGTIGRIAKFGKETNIAFQRSVAFFRFENDNPDYLLQFMFGVSFQKELDKRKVVSAQPGVYLGDLAKISIQRPCIEEQQKIATYLSRIDTKIECVNNQITQTQTFKKGLLQQMFV